MISKNIENQKRLKKIVSHSQIGGAYYSEDKDRYIRIWREKKTYKKAFNKRFRKNLKNIDYGINSELSVKKLGSIDWEII